MAAISPTSTDYQCYSVGGAEQPLCGHTVFIGSTAKYVGCYTEGSHADSFEGPTSSYYFNGPAKCAANCFKEGYMYAGLNRNTCKCGSMVCTYRMFFFLANCFSFLFLCFQVLYFIVIHIIANQIHKTKLNLLTLNGNSNCDVRL